MTPAARADLLRRMHAAMVAAADPARVLPAHLASLARPKGRTVLLAFGKAALGMARTAVDHWPGPLGGVVVVPKGSEVADLPGLRVMQGSHPVPDATSQAAAQALLDAVRGLTPDDLVLALVSGGGSALVCSPTPGLNMGDKQAATRALLKAGATIQEINTLRKHLSAIKGGRLAQAAMPARLVTLAISDIPGDDLAWVASGPTLPDASTCGEALAIVDHHAIPLPNALRQALRDGRLETPKPGDACFSRADVRCIARAQDGLDAAAAVALEAGYTPVVLSDRMEGEARALARLHFDVALRLRKQGQALQPPFALISGGEATVTVTGQGRGGRNTEFALAFALAAQGVTGLSAMSAGTDGVDGSADAAGAIVDETTLPRAAALGLDLCACLQDNDSFTALDALGSCVRTGLTGTNINDLRGVLVDAA